MAQQIEQKLNSGLWRDSEISLQPPNSYNDALNMRLISDDGNNFSLETIKGNLNILAQKLTPNYQIIGWTTSPNKIVVFSTNGQSNPNGTLNASGNYPDSNGEIGIITFAGDTNTGTYTPLYNHQSLNFSTSFQIEARVFPENPSIERVYWVEKHNPPRSLNIANPSLQFYYDNVTVGRLLFRNQSYMVLSGTVTQSLSSNPANNGTFGPNQPDGSVFLFDPVASTIVLSPSFGPTIAKVIAYSPTVETVNSTPNKELGNIRYDHVSDPTGELLQGTYQYAYRLITSDGALSTWSYVTVPTPLVSPFPGDNIFSYQHYEGGVSSMATTKSIFVLIEGIDTSYTRIQVAAIHSTALTVTDLPVIFFDGDITGETMEFEHKGGENFGTITIDDLKQILIAFNTVATLEIQKNRLFYANAETASPQFDFDPSAATGTTVTPIQYLVPSDIVGNNNSDTIDYSNSPSPPITSPIETVGGLNGHFRLYNNNPYIFTDQWYKVTGGTILYNGAIFGDGSINGNYFIGVSYAASATAHSYTVATGTPVIVGVIRIQKYTGTYDYIEVDNDFADTKGMAVSTFLKSYWRGETYRFGILVWDKLGNPTFVRWMEDKEMPEQYEVGGWPITANDINGMNTVGDARLMNVYEEALPPPAFPPNPRSYSASLRHIGINVSNLDLGQVATSLGVPLAELDQYIDGFSVVRAKRDPQVYAQGIMLETAESGTDTICVGSTYRNNVAAPGQYQRANVFNIYAPDLMFQYLDRASNIDISTDFIKTIDIRYDIDDTGDGVGSFGYSETENGHHYEKYYITAPGAYAGIRDKGSQNTFIFQQMISVGNDNGGSGFSYGVAGEQFKNIGITNDGVAKNTKGALTLLSYLANNDIIENTAGSNLRYKPVVNFIRPNGNLYGGQSDQAKANTQYLYCGHYQKMDAAFMSYLVGNAGKVDNIEVFGGDCFVNVFDFARQICENSNGANKISFGMLFPVESDMNIALREGRHLSRDGSKDGVVTNSTGVSFNPSQPEEFVYNGVYSYEEINVLYAALPTNFIPNNKFGYRVFYSNQKANGEFFDSFKIFLANNYRDVEGWAGDITNLRQKDGKLFYWQNHAFGYLPVNERITLSGGGGLGTPTTIGEGGVLTRFDELKRYYGNQHQWGLAETEDSFVWFDARRKAFCHANMGGGIIELSTIKGLIAFFANGVHGNVITHDNPVNKMGISAAYDSRFREVLMTFKGVSHFNPNSPFEQLADTHFTIGFNNLYKYFSALYSFVPGTMIEFNNRFLSPFEGFAPSIVGNTSYVVGNEVSENDDNYVNILSYTTPPVPIQPASDTTHWIRGSTSQDVYMHNIGDVAKFYGIVRDNYVRLVVNANRGIPKIFDNHLFLGMDNGFFFTDYTANNPLQIGADTGIVVTNRGEYQTDYSGIYSTIPQSGTGVSAIGTNVTPTGRLVGHWLQILLRKDNKLNGSIIDSSNEAIKFVSLQTKFRPTV